MLMFALEGKKQMEYRCSTFEFALEREKSGN